jgi:hypothetical protein
MRLHNQHFRHSWRRPRRGLSAGLKTPRSNLDKCRKHASQLTEGRGARVASLIVARIDISGVEAALGVRIQSSHGFDQRGLDAYFTCPEAIEVLLVLEGDRLPQTIWPPATTRSSKYCATTVGSCTRPTSPITGCPAATSWSTSPPQRCRLPGSIASSPIRLQIRPALRRAGARRGALCRVAGANEFPDGRRAPWTLARPPPADT